MAFYEIGKTIRLDRECGGHTLETLSEGICSPQTLYRIEKGRSKMKGDYLNMLVEKLNKCQERHKSVFIGDTPQTLLLKNEIQNALSYYDYKKAILLLDELEQMLGSNVVTRQYLIREHTIISYAKKEFDVNVYIERMIHALELTAENSFEYRQPVYPFRMQEIKILINIAGRLPELNKNDDAHRLYRRLLRIFNHSYICGREVIQAKIVVLRNYAMLYQMEGQYKKGTALEKVALQLSIRNNYGRHLPVILEGLSCKYYSDEMQESSMEPVPKDRLMGARILRQAYYISLAKGQPNITKIIHKSYESKYGLESL